jgi:hypothetical protein
MSNKIQAPGNSRPGRGQGPPQGQPDIDPTDLPEVECECGSNTFQEAYKMKMVSKIVSPTGEEGLMPIQTFVCSQCGKEHNEFKIEGS